MSKENAQEKLRFSVTAVCMQDTTFEEDLEVLKEAGIGGYGLSEQKLRDGEEERQLEAFNKSGLTATVCLPANLSPISPQPAYIYPGPKDLNERIDLMCKSVDRIAPFNPTCIVFCTGSNVGMDPDLAWKQAILGIKEVTQYAATKNVQVALEATRHIGGSDFTWLTTLEETIRFMDEVNEPTLGLCYDFYHLWDNWNILELSERYAKRIFGAQISDWRDTIHSCDRLLPGDGKIDLPGLIGALERGGYTGWYDCEVFSDDGRWGDPIPDSLWKLPVKEFVTRANAGFRKVWEARS